MDVGMELSVLVMSVEKEWWIEEALRGSTW
jgi:hypothetical protein